MKVSVVIPCYNAENFIHECLRSVNDQTYEEIEIVAVNDGSTDETSKLLHQWNRKEKLQIKIVETENKGAPAARNEGLKSVTGEYIQFLDADDLLLPHKISHQISLVRQGCSRPDIVASAYQKQLSDGRIIHDYPGEGDPWIELIGSNLGITSSNLFKRSALNKIDGFNPRWENCQEYELMFRLLKQPGCYVLIDKNVQTRIRKINPDSISLSSREQNILRFIELRQQMVTHLQETDQLTNEMVVRWKQATFNFIKQLYKYNSRQSLLLFDHMLPDGFNPEISGSVSKRYLRVYKLFGFKWTQWIYSLKKQIFNSK